MTESIPCNLPFERLPTCACDPGSGPTPTKQQRLECQLRDGPCALGMPAGTRKLTSPTNPTDAQMLETLDFQSAFCNDRRVYAVIDLANAVLGGRDLTPEQRERLAAWPHTVALLDWMAEARERGLNRVGATPGPEATAETFAAEWLRSLKEPRCDAPEDVD